jgi:hypothetical protein
MTGRGSVKPPAAGSSPRTGLRRPRRVAGLPVRRTLRTRGKQPAPRDGWRSARLPMMGRMSPTWCASPGGRAPTPAAARRCGRRGRGQRGTLAHAEARGAVPVSDRPGGRPVPGPARMPARNAGTPAAGRTDGTGTHGGSARQPMSDQERAAIRQAGADDARRSRAEHGFPERIEDPAAVAVLAALLRAARAPPRNETGRRTSTPAA